MRYGNLDMIEQVFTAQVVFSKIDPVSNRSQGLNLCRRAWRMLTSSHDEYQRDDGRFPSRRPFCLRF